MTITKRLLLLAIILTPLYASAQSDLVVKIIPENPGPDEEVLVSLESYSVDLDTATISWKSGNTTLLSGYGAKRLTTRVGKMGTEKSVSYAITAGDGTTMRGSIALSPRSMTLAYESIESYVPPFYEGRSLPGEGSAVRVVATPNISENNVSVPLSKFAYSWLINGTYSENISGAGKSSAIINLDYLSEATEVRVVARTPKGSTVEKTITIRPHLPMPLLYTYDEILGTQFTQLQSKRVETGKPVTFSLEPYYLSTRGSLAGGALYTWSLDGLPVTPTEKTVLSLRPKENSYGSRILTVAVDNTRRIFQKAETSLEIIFDTRAE